MADDERNSDSSSSDKLYDNYSYGSSTVYGGNVNAFANDGSFLEMFKKKMEDEKKQEGTTTNESKPSKSTPIAPPRKSSLLSSVRSLVGKRRGGKVLPTGMVKKVRKDHVQVSIEADLQDHSMLIIYSFLAVKDKKNDAWSQYMAEVKKYKDRSCEDEGKTRPLVK
uniref:Uncharacterized protein n=1 Tax=Strigamia maritima TaxID=126957 RepID=T1JKX6_STRMM